MRWLRRAGLAAGVLTVAWGAAVAWAIHRAARDGEWLDDYLADFGGED